MSSSMHLLVQPLDVWMFRDGKPFNAGSNHYASTMFPPLPSVIQGAVRSTHAAIHNANMDEYVVGKLPELEKEIGAPDSEVLPFQLEGPHPVICKDGAVTRYLPRPADAFAVKGGLRALQPASFSGTRSNLPKGLQLLRAVNANPVNEKCDEPDEDTRWVCEDALRGYLQAEASKDQEISRDALAGNELFGERENRYGIAMRYDTRMTEEGALYEADFLRLRPEAGLEVRVWGLAGWPESGVIKLGGEHRLASFRQLTPASHQPSKPENVPRRFKLYFATPAFFEGGWKPDVWSAFFDGATPNLVAAAITRYESRGGFSLYAEASRVGNPHKPARRFVPAGSVYYFETSEGTTLKSFSVTEYGAAMGYGQVMIGRWN